MEGAYYGYRCSATGFKYMNTTTESRCEKYEFFLFDLVNSTETVSDAKIELLNKIYERNCN